MTENVGLTVVYATRKDKGLKYAQALGLDVNSYMVVTDFTKLALIQGLRVSNLIITPNYFVNSMEKNNTWIGPWYSRNFRTILHLFTLNTKELG